MNTIFPFTSYIETIIRNFGLDPTLVWFGNTIAEYIGALAALAIFLIVFKIFQLIVLGSLRRLAERTETDIDDTLIKIVRSLRPPFYSFISFYLAIQFLALNDFISRSVDVVLIIWVVYQVIIAVQIFIDYLVERRFGKEEDTATRSALSLIGNIAKGVLWGFGILMILSNLGVNISSLLAGLGIGGIAVAFALQNILGDLFSSFAIYFDKPFQVGDFIIAGSHMGTVEKIGIKTSRIRALQGEEIVISNAELTSARVQNFKKMEERRIQFSFGVVYQTSAEKMKAIPAMVEDAVKAAPNTRFDRAHFKLFDDSALTFEVVYYVLDQDYALYMDIQQQINLHIMERFEKEGIEFAYPTRTIYTANA